jgi:hypothetical protein
MKPHNINPINLVGQVFIKRKRKIMTNEDIKNKIKDMKVYKSRTGQEVIINFDNNDSEEYFVEIIQLLIDKIYMLNPNFNYETRPHIYLKVNVDETES